MSLSDLGKYFDVDFVCRESCLIQSFDFELPGIWSRDECRVEMIEC